MAFADCAKSPAPRIAPTPQLQTAPRSRAPSWGGASRRELQETIRAALAPAVASSYAWSCVVIAQDGSTLYDDRGSQAVIPASAQKIIAADAALTLLGPAYRFHTYFETADTDFWLVGSGDPSLRSDDLRRGVQKIAAGDKRPAADRVMVDAGALAGGELNPNWDIGDENEDFMAPTSGISVDEDTVEFRVAGTTSGASAEVKLKPESGAVKYSGTIVTGSNDDVTIAGTGKPNEFRISGTIPPGIHEIFYLPIHDVPLYAGVVLTQMLREAGMDIVRDPSRGIVPRNAVVLWDHPSPALPQLVRHMLIWSDNHFAEQFLRTFGGRNGRAANDVNGVAAEKQVLRAQRIPTPGLHLVDGSGLAEANRVAGITLARILAFADADPRGNALYPLLARGGKDGTLKWYHFAQAAGRVRAKSGHLGAVSSLAGYVETRRHGRVVFAFLFNGSRDAADRPIVAALNRIAQR